MQILTLIRAERYILCWSPRPDFVITSASFRRDQYMQTKVLCTFVTWLSEYGWWNILSFYLTYRHAPLSTMYSFSLGCKKRSALKADNLTAINMSRLSSIWGSLDVSQPYRPARPVKEIALLYFTFIISVTCRVVKRFKQSTRVFNMQNLASGICSVGHRTLVQSLIDFK
jgi:hypothetical protein